MPHHLLTNFRIQLYYQNELKFNGIYSRNNSPERKDGAYGGAYILMSTNQLELISVES